MTNPVQDHKNGNWDERFDELANSIIVRGQMVGGDYHVLKELFQETLASYQRQVEEVLEGMKRGYLGGYDDALSDALEKIKQIKP